MKTTKLPAVRLRSSASTPTASRVLAKSPGPDRRRLKQPPQRNAAGVVQWRRPVETEWASGKQRVWFSRCGKYRINLPLLDKSRNPFHVCTGNPVWSEISKHGAIEAAKAVCDRHAKKGGAS